MSEQQVEARLAEIRQRRAQEYGHSFTGTRGTDAAMADIDYLLSLLSRPTSERRCGECGKEPPQPKI